jgi:hypothetical protein
MLEKELRNENKAEQAAQDSQAAGGAAQPTPDTRQKLQMYAPKDTGFRYYGNKLGDYSTMLIQMRADAQHLAQPMLASTLESKKEAHKLATANAQLDLLANQFGLNARADRVFKKARKTPKMSAQDHFL